MKLWEDKNILDFGHSHILTTCEVTSQSRDGTTQSYEIKISMWVTADAGYSGTYYNNKWFCNVKIGTVSIAQNLQIKATTNRPILGNVYTQTVSGSVTVSGDTGSETISVEYKDGTTNTSFTTLNAQVSYNPLSVVSLGLSSYNHNSANLSYSYSNIAPERVDIYMNNSYYTTVYGSPFSVTGLSPDTTYTFKGYGYANGAFGSNGNQVTFTTHPSPVYVNSISVSGVQPFQATVNIASSSYGYTDDVEYQLLNASGGVVASYSGLVYSWTPTNLSEETQYRFRVRVKTKTSGVWSDYSYSSFFTTTADQASAYVKVGDTWRKGKVYTKVGNNWLPAKRVYIKVGNNWIQGVNT